MPLTTPVIPPTEISHRGMAQQVNLHPEDRLLAPQQDPPRLRLQEVERGPQIPQGAVHRVAEAEVEEEAVRRAYRQYRRPSPHNRH